MLAMFVGVQMQMIAQGYLVYNMTGSAALLGLVSAGGGAPILVLSLFGGVMADRVDRKRILQMCQGASGLLALLVGLAITTDIITWYHIMATSVFQGILFAFKMPARQAIIPQLVGRDQLSNAMALYAAAVSVTMLAAPALAGTLYALFGADGVFYIIAGLGVAAMFFTGMISKVDGGPVQARAPMITDIIAGLSYIKRSPLVLTLLIIGLATVLLAMPFRFLLPIFVVDVYGRGPESLGLLASVMGLGSLVGALFIASLGRWKRGLLLYNR